MNVDAYVIAILAFLAGLSFTVNSAMKIMTRAPMSVLMFYFSCIYAYIAYFQPEEPIRESMVRLGLLFFFLNIIDANSYLAIALRGKRITFGRRVNDRVSREGKEQADTRLGFLFDSRDGEK